MVDEKDDKSVEERASEGRPDKAGNRSRMVVPPDEAVFRMQIPYSFGDPPTYQRFSLYQLIYALSGLILGLVCILGGIVLFLNGVAGSTNWTAKMLGAESKVSDAAPGAVLFIVGLFIVLVTRFSIKVRK
jgi:hypothetical protein